MVSIFELSGLLGSTTWWMVRMERSQEEERSDQ